MIGVMFVLGARAQGDLKVELVLNEPDAGGTLRLALCPNAEAYETQIGCSTKNVRADGPIVWAEFPRTAAGTYAIKVFHDVNGNGTIDTNWMGIPNEPYGFSNDAMGTFGPPGFNAASFVVGPKVTTVRIRMKG